MSIESVVTDIVGAFQNETLHATLDFSAHYLTGLGLADLFYHKASDAKKAMLGLTGFLPDIDYLGEAMSVMEHRQYTHESYFSGFGILGIISKKPLNNIGFIASNILLHLAADQADSVMNQIDYLVIAGTLYAGIKTYRKSRNIQQMQTGPTQ